MYYDKSEKNFLVIGGFSGIGEEIVRQLLAQNYMVYATFNSSSPSMSSDCLTYFKFNVLEDELDLEELPIHIDGLVYCPGSINLKPFEKFDEDDFINDFKLQVTGAIKVIQQTLDLLKQAESPSILLFSTLAVQLGYNFHTQEAVSKGAIEGLTKSLAAEFAPKIRVNCIAPSLTDTPLVADLLTTSEEKELQGGRHPLGRVGERADIASAALFLLTDKSSWITGQILHVDGGLSTVYKSE